MDTAALLKALHWRYAVKVFDAERTIPADTWAALEEVLILSASSYGLLESLSGYGELMRKDLITGPRSRIITTWAANQVYIALGTLLTSAALLGVDTCPIEGFSPAECDRILALEGTPYQSAVVCACGYRSAEDPYAKLAKVRYPGHELIEYR